MPATEALTSPEAPHPPRYWWLKRISLGSAIVLLFLALVRIAWGWDANRRLQAAINTIRSRGEPILPQDFASTKVSDTENYVYYFNQALAAFSTKVDSPRQSDQDFENYPPFPPNWYAMTKAAMAANVNCYTLLRSARDHQKVDWGVDWPEAFRAGIGSVLFSRLPITDMRSMANLLVDSAQYHHLSGNDAEAVELILDLFAMSAALDKQPMLVSHLVAVGLDSLGLEVLQMMAPAIQVSAGSSSPNAKPTTRDRIEQMIALLLDPDRCNGLKMVLFAERAWTLQMFEDTTRAGMILRPMYKLDVIGVLPMNDPVIDNVAKPSFGGPADSPEKGNMELAHLASNLIASPLNRMLETEARVRAGRAMTAISLAARLYQIDHEGRWPANLDALVPAYLPAIPIDPMSPDARPVGYVLAQNGTRPLVYCMGEKRQEGSPLDNLPDKPMYGYQIRTPFQWRDLSRFTAP